MDLEKAIIETESMVKTLVAGAEKWQQNIQWGRLVMQQMKTLTNQIFNTENEMTTRDKRRFLQVRQKRLTSLFERQQEPLTTMQYILKTLGKVRDDIDRMRHRLALWMDDEIVAKHQFGNLKTTKLMELLEFLSGRYSAEWEVKEVVVRNLDRINNPNELDFLVEAWSTCRHSDDDEYKRLLIDFYNTIGRRYRFLVPAT